MTDSQVHMCVICAWRKDCRKKFSVSKDPNPHCADFSRDVSIKLEDVAKESEKKSKANQIDKT